MRCIGVLGMTLEDRMEAVEGQVIEQATALGDQNTRLDTQEDATSAVIWIPSVNGLLKKQFMIVFFSFNLNEPSKDVLES